MSVSASKEKRSKINFLMQREELRDGAFADYEAAKKITPIEARYRVVLDILPEEELAQYGLPSDYLPPLLLAKWQSAKYICKRIEKIGMTKQDVAMCTGIDQTTLSKYASGTRAAGLESQNLLPLSYNIFHESCHKVVFGENGRIVLPGMFSVAAEDFEQLSTTQQEEILTAAHTMEMRFNAKNPADSISGLRHAPFALAKDRLWIIAAASGRGIDNFFGEPTVKRLRNLIRIYFEDLDLYVPSTSALVFIAFETGMALDYFISENFVKYVDCYYNVTSDCEEAESSAPKLITQNDTKELIRILFLLDEEDRLALAAKVVSMRLSEKMK